MTRYRALADGFVMLDLGLIESESAAIANKSTGKEAVRTRGRESVRWYTIAPFYSRLVILFVMFPGVWLAARERCNDRYSVLSISE
jgi:hypothetical protein